MRNLPQDLFYNYLAAFHLGSFYHPRIHRSSFGGILVFLASSLYIYDGYRPSNSFHEHCFRGIVKDREVVEDEQES